ncbi:ZZ-type zinc finger-containing protein 3 [Acyrthosiphon pisum]|uniref:ZZ-type domain-containing protein n=1 Tax=Acyrthosiphon pisum TaxID=7029 RepID=A0A8R2H659_ACYPI|nr:ZZ-type zinc finger-containing protein 3 [Acyrthosiphon pisum]XP_016659670.1 ZZ-type zinc finger-containing protein 3 [Acyrthosiphon pisum]|eukprot:XP_016659669.1 PREDICTED: ZZ-type zinc finger-containing protein 3 [Acyrthosiphon pisum]
MDKQFNDTNVSDSKALEATEFYFESDFYLLKNNNDYKNLLKSLAILEVQRCTTIQNIEKLAVLKDHFSKNPSLALKKVLKREDIGTLKSVNIHPLPDIDWSVYITNDETESGPIKQVCDINLRHKNVSDKQETPTNITASEVEKPETFKKPWTVEEQLRLEELLIEYPPERNESNRYRKIADALGTRNLRQVCSRVQKYNMKMKKVGSIKSINANSKNLNKKTVSLSHKNIGALLKPTTFIPSTTLIDDVDVYNANRNNFNVSHKNIEMSNKTKLAILDEVLQDKLTEKNCPIVHVGYTCCVCQSSPIIGTRWNCNDCPAIGKNSNFCGDCIVDTVRNILEKPPHPMDHTVTPIRSVKANDDNIDNLIDQNYVPLVFKTQNYLDPNFMV